MPRIGTFSRGIRTCDAKGAGPVVCPSWFVLASGILRGKGVVVNIREFISDLISIEKYVVLEVSQPASVAGATVKFRRGTRDDLTVLKAPHLGYSEQSYAMAAKAFAAGDVLMVGEIDSQICAYGWCAIDYLPVAGSLHLKLPHGTGYFYRVFTAEQFRGKRIAVQFVNFLLQWLREQGIARTLSIVECRNRPSLAFHRTMGARPVGHLRHWKILGRDWLNIDAQLRQYLTGNFDISRHQ